MYTFHQYIRKVEVSCTRSIYRNYRVIYFKASDLIEVKYREYKQIIFPFKEFILTPLRLSRERSLEEEQTKETANKHR